MFQYALMIGDTVCNVEDVPPGTTTHPSQMDAITRVLRRAGCLDDDEHLKLVTEVSGGYAVLQHNGSLEVV